jgi:sortase A
MGSTQQSPNELSIAELESLLARKRIEARKERIALFHRSGRALRLMPTEAHPIPVEEVAPSSAFVIVDEAEPKRRDVKRTLRAVFNRGLLLVEIAAAAGLGFVFLSGYGILQELNREVSRTIGATPSPTPLITALVLPSGHTPPTSPGGAMPNEDEIPNNLRPLVQSLPAVSIPTPGPEHARSIFIPAIWDSPAPVVQGDGWEQLKKGVGQHVGSANPGENGNMVLSAHNDIFGELFKDLDRLKPGDEVRVTAGGREYVYRVTGFRIVEPTEVDVMSPTARPTATLISCYPYLVDNQRIAVFAELDNG